MLVYNEGIWWAAYYSYSIELHVGEQERIDTALPPALSTSSSAHCYQTRPKTQLRNNHDELLSTPTVLDYILDNRIE